MDAFTNAYIECLEWADCGPDSECHNGQFAKETIEQCKRDCEAFLASMPRDGMGRTLIDLAIDYAPKAYDLAQAGHDFWLTRNGHGAGFWDRGLGAIGDQLTKHAKSFGEVSPYLGDDGLIYLG